MPTNVKFNNKKTEEIIKRLTELYFQFCSTDVTDEEKKKLEKILYKIYHQMSENKLKEHYKNCLIAITVFNKNPFGLNYIESLAQPALSNSSMAPILKQEKKPIVEGAALKDILNDIFMDETTHTVNSLKEIIEDLIKNLEYYDSSKEEKKIFKYLDSLGFWGEVNDLENLDNITREDLLIIINYNENNKKQAVYKLVLK